MYRIFNSNFIFKIIFTLIIFLPIFYIPLNISNINFSKTFLIYLAVLILSLVSLIDFLIKKEKFVHFNIYKVGISLILISSLFSTIFSKNVELSFWGRDFALDSFVTIVSLFILLCITAKNIKKDLSLNVIWTLIFVSGFLSGIQILHVLVPSFPNLGIFYDLSANTIGKINDFSIFATIGLIFSVLAIEQLKVSRFFLFILYFIGILNFLSILFINFNLNLIIIAVFGIFFIIYKFTFFNEINNKLKGKDLEIISFNILITIISISAIFFGSNYINTLSKKMNYNYVEVRPSLGATLELANNSLKDNLLFGSGLATFEYVWPKYRSQDVLRSEFWSLDFRYGFSLITSFVSTTGILGIASWFIFFCIIFWGCFKLIFFEAKDIKNKFIIDSFSIGTIILWLFIALYIPTITIVALAFIFTGITIALLIDNKIIDNKKILINKNILVLIFTFAFFAYVFLFTNILFKFIAHINFQRSLVMINQNNSEKIVLGLLDRAIYFDGVDNYHRSLAKIKSNIFFEEINKIKYDNNNNLENSKKLLFEIVNNFNIAISYDNYNYNNHIALADFYADLLPLKITDEDLYSKSNDLYNIAFKLRPNDPKILLKKAKLEFLNGSIENSKSNLIEAIKIRPQYFDAYMSISELEFGQGNSVEGINILKEYLKIVTNDPNALFQLGLAHIEVGEYNEAKNIFEILNKSYPENSDIKSILSDLNK